MLIICWALTAFWVLLIVRVIFSWIPRPPDPLLVVNDVAVRATDWAVAPLRNAIPPMRMGAVALDQSILVLFFGVNILQAILC